jgi:hypothetical protein
MEIKMENFVPYTTFAKTIQNIKRSPFSNSSGGRGSGDPKPITKETKKIKMPVMPVQQEQTKFIPIPDSAGEHLIIQELNILKERMREIGENAFSANLTVKELIPVVEEHSGYTNDLINVENGQ